MNPETEEIEFQPTHYDLLNDRAFMEQEDGSFMDEDGNENINLCDYIKEMTRTNMCIVEESQKHMRIDFHKKGIYLIPIRECFIKVFKVMKWIDFDELPMSLIDDIIADARKRLSKDVE